MFSIRSGCRGPSKYSRPRKKGPNSDDLSRTSDGPSPFGLCKAKNGRDERACMADTNKEDEIGDIDSPEDGSRKACNAQTVPILVLVRVDSPKDDRHEDQESEIKGPSRFADRFEQNSVLFRI